MSSDSALDRGLLFVVSAPSATGKTTVVDRLVEVCPTLVRSRSYTSRAARAGEQDGVDYNFVTRPAFDGMVERGWGRIINVSSVNGQKGAFGQTNYSAAKAGMHGFTKALAYEVARKGVTVNTISPGYIGTKMVMAIPKDVLDAKILPQIPMGRLGMPEEIAGLIIYLASDEAGFVTGANIAINGGQHMQ